MGEVSSPNSVRLDQVSGDQAPPARWHSDGGKRVGHQVLGVANLLIVDTRLDVLASNHLAGSLYTDSDALPVKDRNMARVRIPISWHHDGRESSGSDAPA